MRVAPHVETTVARLVARTRKLQPPRSDDEVRQLVRLAASVSPPLGITIRQLNAALDVAMAPVDRRCPTLPPRQMRMKRTVVDSVELVQRVSDENPELPKLQFVEALERAFASVPSLAELPRSTVLSRAKSQDPRYWLRPRGAKRWWRRPPADRQ